MNPSSAITRAPCTGELVEVVGLHLDVEQVADRTPLYGSGSGDEAADIVLGDGAVQAFGEERAGRAQRLCLADELFVPLPRTAGCGRGRRLFHQAVLKDVGAGDAAGHCPLPDGRCVDSRSGATAPRPR